jgi:hypothetical protein
MGHLLSSAIKMQGGGIPTGTFSVTYAEFPGSLAGGVFPLKNGSAYLTRLTAGTSTGTITTGDTFSVSLSVTEDAYRYLLLSSSSRGTLYLGELEPGMPGTLASGTFTKIDNEDITINAIADFT